VQNHTCRCTPGRPMTRRGTGRTPHLQGGFQAGDQFAILILSFV
jgi:hypothetical protein